MKKMMTVLMCIVAVTLMAGPVTGIAYAAQKEGAQAVEAITTPAAPKDQAASPKVNLNTAGAAELEKLPGIGPKMAEEIVKYRETNGPFKTVEDLKQVKGVGDKKMESLKDRISVE